MKKFLLMGLLAVFVRENCDASDAEAALLNKMVVPARDEFSRRVGTPFGTHNVPHLQVAGNEMRNKMWLDFIQETHRANGLQWQLTAETRKNERLQQQLTAETQKNERLQQQLIQERQPNFAALQQQIDLLREQCDELTRQITEEQQAHLDLQGRQREEIANLKKECTEKNIELRKKQRALVEEKQENEKINKEFGILRKQHAELEWRYAVMCSKLSVGNNKQHIETTLVENGTLKDEINILKGQMGAMVTNMSNTTKEWNLERNKMLQRIRELEDEIYVLQGTEDEICDLQEAEEPTLK